MSEAEATESATCKCTACGNTFETSAYEDGRILFDGVREHGRKHGREDQLNDRWNYEIIDRPSQNDE